MYEVFDSFLARDTWFKMSDFEEKHFYQRLQMVVRFDEFNPDELGDYIRQQKGISREDEDQYFNQTVEDIVRRAHAVRDYLQATNE